MFLFRYGRWLACLLVAQVVIADFDNSDSSNLQQIRDRVTDLSGGFVANPGNGQYWMHWMTQPTTANGSGAGHNDNFVDVLSVIYNAFAGNYMARQAFGNYISDWRAIVGNSASDFSNGTRNIFNILADNWAMMHNFTEKDFYSLMSSAKSPNFYYYLSQTLTNLYSAVEYSTSDDSFRDNPKTILDFLDCFYTSATNYFERQLAFSEQTALGASGAAFNTTNLLVMSGGDVSYYYAYTPAEILHDYENVASANDYNSFVIQNSPFFMRLVDSFGDVNLDWATFYKLEQSGLFNKDERFAWWTTWYLLEPLNFMYNGYFESDTINAVANTKLSLYGTYFLRQVINTNVFIIPEQTPQLVSLLNTNNVSGDDIFQAAQTPFYKLSSNEMEKVDVGSYEEIFDDRLDDIKHYRSEIEAFQNYRRLKPIQSALDSESDKFGDLKIADNDAILTFDFSTSLVPSRSSSDSEFSLEFDLGPSEEYLDMMEEISAWLFGFLRVAVVVAVIYKCYGKLDMLFPSK